MKKKHLFLTLMGAIALTGTVGFTSCSSDDNVAAVEDNPTYDPVAKTVNTQFVLNVASPEMQSTRQSSVTVQQNQNFRGMQDAKLIALSTEKGYDTGNPANNLAPFAGNSTGYGVVKTFDLGTLYAAGQVSNESTNNAESSSRRVLQMSLPLTTDAMLVYARAIPSVVTDGEKVTTEEKNGKVDITIAEVPEQSTFELVSRIGDNSNVYNKTLALSAAIINQIFDSNILEQAAGGTAIHGYSNVAAVPALTWKDLGDAYKAGTALLPLQEVMGKLYYSVTNIKSGEYRAGSSSSVCRLMYSIYKNAETVTSVAATSDAEYNAQRLAKEIMSRIAKYFTEFDSAHDSDSNPPSDKNYELATKFEAISTIQTNLADADFAEKYSDVTADMLAGFPSYFKLPEGVALLSIDSSDNFSYKLPTTTTLATGTTINATNYMYPAELLYFDNSLLRVNDVAKQETDYPNGYNEWNVPTGSQTWEGWTVGKVASTTRSVAVKNNINYGVAMLKTSVTLVGDANGEFSDNRHGIYTEEQDQKLATADVSAFTLKGVLIGGQNHQMGWNYLATETYNTAADWNYVIYDTAIPNEGKIPTTDGNENYTLVFDNYKAGESSQSDVYVALEFVNNSTKAFYGQHNMIPVGGTFYLVAKLELGSKKITDWDEYYAVPPYKANGKSEEITRVFVQDFMTSATFKIGTGSLRHAYLTVPDLRSTQISLGLSVDLHWRTGINFGSVTLGGE